MVTVAASLLAATAVKQTRNKRLRNDRIKKSVWVRQRLLTRDKYGMYEKLIKHLKQGDVKSFRNFVRMDPGMFNQMVKDLFANELRLNSDRIAILCEVIESTLRHSHDVRGNVAFWSQFCHNKIVRDCMGTTLRPMRIDFAAMRRLWDYYATHLVAHIF